MHACPCQEQLDVISQLPPDLDPHSLAVTSKLRAETTILDLLGVQAYLHSAVLAALAAAVVASGQLPPKFNAVIQPLMASVRKEPEAGLQRSSAEAIAQLVVLCQGRAPNPTGKLIRNVCQMACGDPAVTPCASDPWPDDAQEGDGTAAAAAPAALRAPQPHLATARAGAEAALRAVCARFGARVFEAVPALWGEVAGALEGAGVGVAPTGDPQAVINALHVLRVVGPMLHEGLLPTLLAFITKLAGCCRHPHGAVRAAAAACAAELAAAQAEAVVPPLLNLVVPMLYSSGCKLARQGAVQVRGQSGLRSTLFGRSFLMETPFKYLVANHEG